MAEHLKRETKPKRRNRPEKTKPRQKSESFLSRLLGTGMARGAAKAAKKRNQRLKDL